MNFRKLKKAYRYVQKNGLKKSLKKLLLRRYVAKNRKNSSEKYEDYIFNREPSREELNAQKEILFSYQPKISFVVPMYDTKFEFFVELIESLLAQTYANFEICLADGSMVQDKQIQAYIEGKKDARIQYQKLSKNGGISSNTNEAIKMATGDYIAFCDHDDVVAEHALFEIVTWLNQDPKIDFLYTDEDILENGRRKNPHFKPDFSPDLLTSYNYICHLCVVKKELLDQVGLLRSQMDGAQDYDFVLRATNKAHKIVHIPKILYHWRSYELSTAGDSDSKLYAFDAAKMAIEEHFERLNHKVKVSALEEVGRYRVDYEIEGNPKISIVIANKDHQSDLKKCMESIFRSTYLNYEVMIVENNSVKKETFEYYETLMKEHQQVKVVDFGEKEFNYSKLNNFGVKHATGEYLILLNNDTKIITSDWMENMLGICQREEVGIVGAKLFYPDHTVQHAGVVIGIGGVAGHVHLNIDQEDPGYFSRANVINNFSAVTAACLMIKKEVYEKVGGLDEKLKVAFNDIDLCLKVREQGYLVVFTPHAKLYHYESKSRGAEDTKEKRRRFEEEMDRFKEKWHEILKSGDPYYNANLRLDQVNFMIDTEKIGENS